MLRRMAAPALLLVMLAGCARNPVTGAREFVLISESQEIQMGQEYAQQIEQTLGLVDDAELQAYVRRVGEKLAKASERPNLPWRFSVVEDPTPNAFALPGGPIFVTRGMMDLMDSEAELAGVLGHEIGHVTARHSVTQISRSQLAQLGLGLGSIFVPAVQSASGLLSTGLQLLFLKHGRDDERQSDELGFRYALEAGYDVREFDDIFVSLRRMGDRAEKSAIPAFLSTHPDPGERVETAQQRVAALTVPVPSFTGRAEYLRQIDGLVYGDNPRQGFFRDGEFLHPDLRFRIQFPRGWKTQNLTQSVNALSPENDGAIELTFAQGTPVQAAQTFLSSQGIQQVRSDQTTINGKQAVVSLFQAQTEQGTLAGYAVFVSHNNSTYRLLAYSPSSRFQAYDQIFNSVIRSFGTLTDPSALNVQPNRIEIVTLSSAMSLTEFQRRYPSVIELDELSIINQITDVNESLAARTQLKRVRAR